MLHFVYEKGESIFLQTEYWSELSEVRLTLVRKPGRLPTDLPYFPIQYAVSSQHCSGTPVAVFPAICLSPSPGDPTKFPLPTSLPYSHMVALSLLPIPAVSLSSLTPSPRNHKDLLLQPSSLNPSQYPRLQYQRTFPVQILAEQAGKRGKGTEGLHPPTHTQSHPYLCKRTPATAFLPSLPTSPVDPADFLLTYSSPHAALS